MEGRPWRGGAIGIVRTDRARQSGSVGSDKDPAFCPTGGYLLIAMTEWIAVLVVRAQDGAHGHISHPIFSEGASQHVFHNVARGRARAPKRDRLVRAAALH